MSSGGEEGTLILETREKSAEADNRALELLFWPCDILYPNLLSEKGILFVLENILVYSRYWVLYVYICIYVYTSERKFHLV
jgi:hypothetical protein